MHFLIAALTAAVAAEPAAGGYDRVEVRYQVVFDLDARADSVCGVTGFCDCTTVYVGSGKALAEEGDLLTFTGSWKPERNDCHEVLTLWVPATGQAHHTVKLDPARKKVIQWLAHAKADDTTPVTSGMKARGQVWVSPMDAALVDGVARHTEDEEQSLQGLAIKTHHELAVTLVSAAAEAPQP